MAREITVSFCVGGHVKQNIELSPDCKLTVEEIQEKLDNGKLFTTIQENGELLDVEGNVFGKITNVDNHCEYTEFDVEEYN
jgi:hypothetical protein